MPHFGSRFGSSKLGISGMASSGAIQKKKVPETYSPGSSGGGFKDLKKRGGGFTGGMSGKWGNKLDTYKK